MPQLHPSLRLAVRWHLELPDRLRAYLNGRGIPDPIIKRVLLGYNGLWITIPITDGEGKLLFFKFARDPDAPVLAPKMRSPAGSAVELYGWEHLREKPQQLIICEGEFDRLVLEAQGFAAVTSTGGASVFKREWAAQFAGVPELYICFDKDEAGRLGARRVGQLLPQAKLVTLPDEVGPGGDVTDFFTRLGKMAEDFRGLLAAARPASELVEARAVQRAERRPPRSPNDEVERLKAAVKIEEVIGRVVRLRPGALSQLAHCPFHEDRNPSFVVYPHTQSFYCFGCHTHGDVITFLMLSEHLTFLQALDALRRLAG